MDFIKPSDYHTTFFKDSLIKQENIHELVNLHKFFLLAVKFPWLKPLIKKFIKLKPNWLFEQVFVLSFGWMQLRCFRRNPLQLLIMGLGNMKIFYGKKEHSDKRKSEGKVPGPAPEALSLS